MFSRQKAQADHNYSPPALNDIKFNYDASVRYDKSWSAFIARDHVGHLIYGEKREFLSSSVLVTEIEALRKAVL